MLGKVAEGFNSLLSQIDLINRMINVAKGASQLSQQVIHSERKAQSAAAAGLLSAAATLSVAPLVAPNFFVAYSLPPLVGTGFAYLAAAIVPTSREEKEKTHAPVKIQNIQNSLLLPDSDKVLSMESNRQVGTLPPAKIRLHQKDPGN